MLALAFCTTVLFVDMGVRCSGVLVIGVISVLENLCDLLVVSGADVYLLYLRKVG